MIIEYHIVEPGSKLCKNTSELEYAKEIYICIFRSWAHDHDLIDKVKVAAFEMRDFCIENFGPDAVFSNSEETIDFRIGYFYPYANDLVITPRWSWYFLGSAQLVFWFANPIDGAKFKERFEIYGKLAWT